MAVCTDLSCMSILNFLSVEIRSLHKDKRNLRTAFLYILRHGSNVFHSQTALHVCCFTLVKLNFKKRGWLMALHLFQPHSRKDFSLTGKYIYFLTILTATSPFSLSPKYSIYCVLIGSSFFLHPLSGSDERKPWYKELSCSIFSMYLDIYHLKLPQLITWQA